MSPNVGLIKATFDDLMRNGSVETLFASVTDDVVLKNGSPELLPFGGEYLGRDGLGEYFRRVDTVLEISDLRVTDYFESRHKVVVLGDETLRIKASGEEFRSEWCTVFELREGRICRILVIEDHSPLCTYLAAHP